MRRRLAIAAEAVSHFEAPLYRSIAEDCGFDLRVFVLNEVVSGRHFSPEYQTEISWGDEPTAGLSVVKTPGDSKQLIERVGAFRPEALMMCGYSWQGAWNLVLESRIRGLPLVHRGTLNYSADPRTKGHEILRKPFGRALLKLFQTYHVSGYHSVRTLLEHGIGEERMFFVPFGVNAPHFLAASEAGRAAAEGARVRRRLGWQDTDEIVLFIGQISWFKGPDLAVETVSRVQARRPAVKLLVVGDGRMAGEMRDAAKRSLAEDSYRFVGFVPSGETAPFYLAANAVLFTSRYETWARAVNEAMLCGRLCVLHRLIPASGGLVADGATGYVSRSEDPRDMAEKLDQCLRLAPEKRERMEAAAREAAASLSYDLHLGEMVRSVEEAIRLATD